MSEELSRKAFEDWFKSYIQDQDFVPGARSWAMQGWQAAWSTRPAPVIDGEMEIAAKHAIGLTFIPSGIWTIEEGWEFERAARAALQAALGKEGK